MRALAKAGASLTEKEAYFAELYASSGDKRYAAREAGYAYPVQQADKLLRMQKVLDEISRIQDVRMRSEIVPLAVDRLARILRDDTKPTGAHVNAIKVALEYGSKADTDPIEKAPEDMTADEIAEAIHRLEVAAAAGAQDVTPSTSGQADPDGDIFG